MGIWWLILRYLCHGLINNNNNNCFVLLLHSLLASLQVIVLRNCAWSQLFNYHAINASMFKLSIHSAGGYKLIVLCNYFCCAQLERERERDPTQLDWSADNKQFRASIDWAKMATRLDWPFSDIKANVGLCEQQQQR